MTLNDSVHFLHFKYCNRKVILNLDSKINHQFKSLKSKKFERIVSKFSRSNMPNDSSVDNRMSSDLPLGTLMILKNQNRPLFQQ